MQQRIIEMDNNLVLHYINEQKDKSNLIAVFLTVPLLRETVTINALIPAILKRGTSKYINMQQLEIYLQEMYGSMLNSSIDKTGDNHVLKFYTQTIKDEIVQENLFEKSVDNISQLIFSPYLENGTFSSEYTNQEKVILDTIIKDRINNKYVYARSRCIEEIFDNKGYGLYQYGYSEDLKNISSDIIYNQYINILKTAKIDIFVCTNKSEEEVKKTILKYFNYDILNERQNIYVPTQSYVPSIEDEKVVIESANVTQGNLFLGMTIPEMKMMDKSSITVLNALLGVGANSKMFRNIREKEHLAYAVTSSYIKNTNLICIYAGIELINYDKTVNLIKKELMDLRRGSISKREFLDAKKVITYMYNSLSDSPYSVINYYFDKIISNDNTTIEESIKQIEDVKLNSVIETARKINLNIIYYLTNQQMGGAK